MMLARFPSLLSRHGGSLPPSTSGEDGPLKEGQVGYRHGEDAAKPEMMDYLGFIARVTSPIPDKGQEYLWAADPPAEYFP